MYNLYTCLIFSNFVTVDIIVEPQSVSALIGTTAQFHCIANGTFELTWLVDGLLYTLKRIQSRGIVGTVISVESNTIHSMLTVPATLQNNRTSIQCVVRPPGPPAKGVYKSSAIVTLEVLPGMFMVIVLQLLFVV